VHFRYTLSGFSRVKTTHLIKTEKMTQNMVKMTLPPASPILKGTDFSKIGYYRKLLFMRELRAAISKYLFL